MTAMARFVVNAEVEGMPEDRGTGSWVGCSRAARRCFATSSCSSRMDGFAADGSGPITRLIDALDHRRCLAGFGLLPLLESLLKALARDPKRLDHVAGLAESLAPRPKARPSFPDGFEEVWEPIWARRGPIAMTRQLQLRPVRLKDFQRRTVDYVFNRLYGDDAAGDRFLVADEVGLGKTLVARGLIAATIDHLQDAGVTRIDVVYICSNADIARQNISRLNVTGARTSPAVADHAPALAAAATSRQNGLNFVSFTPGTSLRPEVEPRARSRSERCSTGCSSDAWGCAASARLQRACRARRRRERFAERVEGLREQSRARRRASDALRSRVLRAASAAARLERSCRDRCRGFEELVDRGWTRLEEDLTQTSSGASDRRRAPTCSPTLRRMPSSRTCHPRRVPALQAPARRPDEAGELAQRALRYEDVARALLLSATPYKMYTLAEEAARTTTTPTSSRRSVPPGDDASHASVPRSTSRAYRASCWLERWRSSDGCARAQARDSSGMLRRVMVRTERLASPPIATACSREVPSRATARSTPRTSCLRRASDARARLERRRRPRVLEVGAVPAELHGGYKLKRALGRTR